MKKIIMIVALGTAVLATPAFAQSFNPGFGTGNVLPFNGPTASQNVNAAASHQSGRRLYDSAQSDPASSNQSAPAATGAGSAGYNEMLLID
jgi:hypothetical protein